MLLKMLSTYLIKLPPRLSKHKQDIVKITQTINKGIFKVTIHFL